MIRSQVQKMVFTGLMVAIGILLGQLVSISLPNPSDPIIKFGIGYLPIVLVSILFGPVYGLMAGISQDLLGFFLIGSGLGQTFHLGFTLNAALYGVLPGVLFHYRFKSEKQVYFLLNLLLSLGLFSLSAWYFFHIDQVISDSLNQTEKYILLAISLFGALSLVVISVFVYRHPRYGRFGPKLLFGLSLLYILVSLILTPLWLLTLNPGIPFWARIPLRIIKMPIEVLTYVILLMTLIRLFEQLSSKKEETE